MKSSGPSTDPWGTPDAHCVAVDEWLPRRNYLKDGHLMPPERPWIDGLSATGRCHDIQYTQIRALQHELQFCVTITTVTSDTDRPSCLICTLPTQHPSCFFSVFFRGFACMRYINPRLIDWLIDWRRRGWPTRQDVGWQCRSHSGVVWGQQRCAFRKIPSALVHRVWPKIHDHSP